MTPKPLRRSRHRSRRAHAPRVASRRPLVALALLGAAGSLLLFGRVLFAAVPRAGLDRAIAAQHALVDERPADASVHEDLGSLLSLAADWEGAEAAYRRAIELDPTSKTAHFQLGSVLERTGRERKALGEYRAAVKLDPDYAWAHYEIGTLYDRWGVESLAERSYARALALDPSLADPVVNPHILENRLATQAMIRSYREMRAETSAPRSFHEPRRIAGLILERPAAEGDRLAADDAAATAEATAAVPPERHDAGAIGASTAGDAGDAGAAGDSGEAPRVLTSRDLNPGSAAGQVVGGANAAPNRRGSSAEAAMERAKAREAARAAARASRPTGGNPYPLNPAYAPKPDAGGGVGGGTAGGGFVPSPDSTGRLEVRIEERAG